jgi:hypothetical protein
MRISGTPRDCELTSPFGGVFGHSRDPASYSEAIWAPNIPGLILAAFHRGMYVHARSIL